MKKTVAFISIAWVLMAVSTAILPPKPHLISLEYPANWPKPLYNFDKNPLTKEGIELGKKLFYDERLSPDGVTSCTSCHQQFAAFSTYDHPLSHGINNQFTTRNAPALQNLAWKNAFHQDGGINHLDVQFLSPLTASNEMGANLDSVIHYLQNEPSYRRLFYKAFGKGSITTQKMGKALSQFMLSMVSVNSKYDRVKVGKDSFILPEKLGYAIFLQKCQSCHPEPLFTDNNYHNVGMPIDPTLNDVGRKKITGISTDSLKFRTPSLRNVMVTAPYGHDGRFFSIYNVLEHYRKTIFKHPTTDTLLQNGIPLSNYEIGQLTAFLQTLTDSTFLHNKAFTDPNFTSQPLFNHPH